MDNFDVLDKEQSISQDVRETLQRNKLNFDVYEFESIDSTNAHAKRMLERDEADEGTVIFSYDQTMGYARYGREWVSQKGNFFCSIVLKPNIDIRSLSQLSFIVSLAVGRTIRSLFVDSSKNISYKWPNDILIDNKKVAGILLESSMVKDNVSAEWVLVGIGINTISSPFMDVDYPATSLVDEEADPTTEKKMLLSVMENLNFLYNLWLIQGFEYIRDEWLLYSAFKDQEITVNTLSDSFKGVFKDINDKGEMVLSLPDGKMRLVSTGEVFFASNHSR